MTNVGKNKRVQRAMEKNLKGILNNTEKRAEEYWNNTLSPNDPSRFWSMNQPKTFRERHELSLYERVLGGLSTPQASMKDMYKLSKGKNRKQFLFWCRQNRIAYSQCERITLSDNFVRNAVELAYSYPKYIMQLFPKAIPCFDQMFIEWNEVVRWESLQNKFKELGIPVDVNESCVANDVGYYIKKLDNDIFSDHAFGFTFSTCDSEDKGDGRKSGLQLGMAHHGWVIDFGDDANVEHMPNYNNEETLRLFIGGAYQKIFKDDDGIHRLKSLQKHCALHMNEWGDLIWNSGLKDKWTANEHAINSANGYDGDLRFIIAVFSLLNYPRYVREFIRPKKINAPIIWGKKQPQYETKVIEIELPKSGVNIYHQLFTGHGTPKRQHVRRGHWRITKDRYGRLKDRTWIQPCIVGNPELGIINHEYVLRVKQDRDRRNLQ